MFKFRKSKYEGGVKTIYEHMCLESKRLDEQIKMVEAQLKELPEGKLICKKNDKRYKWYRSHNGKQIYIPKKDRKLAEELASKKYLLHLREDLLHEKNAIEFYLRHHKESNVVKMLTDMPEYQELLSPRFKVLSQELEEWKNSPYDYNKNYPEGLKHKTAAGIIVRSKSEALIVMALYTNNIPFRYECALWMGEIVVYPDFTIRHPRTGKIFYWEHFGKMDDEKYANKAGFKLRNYIENQIVPGGNLITTYETKDRPLTMETVQNMIKEYFL